MKQADLVIMDNVFKISALIDDIAPQVNRRYVCQCTDIPVRPSIHNDKISAFAGPDDPGIAHPESL